MINLASERGFKSCPLSFLMHPKYNKNRTERGEGRGGRRGGRDGGEDVGDDVHELWPILDARDLER